jgi:prolipoprotein diacylglyceryltransferase
LALAAITAMAGTLLLARRSGLALAPCLLLQLCVTTGALAGAKVYAAAETSISGQRVRSLDVMGMRYPGVVLGVLSVAPVAHLLLRPPFTLPTFADIASPGLAAAMGVVRVGCVAAGCCHGYPTAGAISMRFPKGSVAWGDHVGRGVIDATSPWSLPVFPLHIFLGTWSLLVALALLPLLRIAWLRGTLFWVYLVLHDGAKAVLETFRDPPEWHLQAFSIGFVVLALAALAWSARRGQVSYA